MHTARQEAKKKAKALKELYFLVEWDDRDDENDCVFDVLPAKLLCVENPLEVSKGAKSQAMYKKKEYSVTIVDKGSQGDMNALQEVMAAELESTTEKSGKPDKSTTTSTITAATTSDTTSDTNDKKSKSAEDEQSSTNVSEGTSTKKIKEATPKKRKKSGTYASTPPKPTKQRKIETTPVRKAKTGTKPFQSPPKKSAKQMRNERRTVSDERAKQSENERISAVILNSTEADFNLQLDEPHISDDSTTSTISAHHNPTYLHNFQPPTLPQYSHQTSPSSVSSPDDYSPHRFNYTSQNQSPLFDRPHHYTRTPAPYMYMDQYQALDHQSQPPMSSVASELSQLRAMMMTTLQGIERLKKDVYGKKKGKKRSRTNSLISSDSEADGGETERSSSQAIPGSILLGDPHSSRHVIIPGYSQTSVRSVEGLATSPAKLALGLADILFTKDELASSLVTKKEGRNLLDPDKIEGIRFHVNSKYPEADGAEQQRWHTLVTKLNDKCRNTRNRSRPQHQ